PDVETVKRGLEPALVGRRIAHVDLRRKDLRIPFPAHFAERLSGKRITGMGRRAKYLLADLDDGETLIIHLGMSGRLTLSGKKALAPGKNGKGGYYHEIRPLTQHDHVVFDLDDGERLVFNDPRRFGLMSLAPTAELADAPFFQHLGIEPLGNELSAEHLLDGLKGRKTSLKAALLNQTFVVGIGNIYACEALHRARLSPKRLCNTMNRERAARLAEAIKAVLTEAIEAGGSSLKDYVQADGSLGYFQHRFAVYDREGQPCPRKTCKGTKIRRIVQSNRSTFYCPNCQR
ncbi:MAG: bifunctional DNA-formamidopyrimidine glycosylase/DNA-(apurinic or apyrimidinic site) lyase, partial [Alphaproteobacteria bacterium]